MHIYQVYSSFIVNNRLNDMSFYTELKVRHTDFEKIDLSLQRSKILEILAEDEINKDVYYKLVDTFNNGIADFNIDSVACLQLIEKISLLLPESSFECRGLGEKYFYTWILCVENGQVIFKNQPWENDNPFI